MSTPLTKHQKAILGQLAQQAWAAKTTDERQAIAQDIADQTGDPSIPPSRVLKIWKHQIQERATGIPSAADMTQEHYADAKGALLAEAGKIRQAYASHYRAHPDEETRRRTTWLLRQSTQARGLAWPGYPLAICRRQYRCELADATPRQLRSLLYTIRNRRKPIKK